jgi:hypothetical protein
MFVVWYFFEYKPARETARMWHERGATYVQALTSSFVQGVLARILVDGLANHTAWIASK